MGQEYKFSRIEEQLIKEGFIDSKDIEKAYDIQLKKIEDSKMPLGIIFVNNGGVSKEKILNLLKHPDIQNNIRTTALSKGLISQRQLSESGTEETKMQDITSIWLKRGYINKTELKKIMYEQLDGKIFWNLALLLGLVSEKALEEALRIKHFKKSICEILHDLNLITLTELNHTFKKINTELILGTILLQQSIVNEDDLNKALHEQEQTSHSLGKILVRNMLISNDQLYFALSIQNDVPFQKLEGFVFYDKQKLDLRDIIGQRYAEEKKMIPLFLNNYNLTIAISNPVNILNAHELRSLYKNLQISCILITEEKFEQLYSILYGEILKTSETQYKKPIDEYQVEERTTLSDLKMQKQLVDNLYLKYKTLQNKIGEKPFESGEKLFQEFIESNYKSTCEKFKCNKVVFWLEVKDNNIRTMALPMQ
ncbi:MAG: hypothetical protein HN737_08655 [Desulfobacterales bacterium]|jgi:hypothetical protein|nr:hypothetical protein [Desulfobacteraceae bacterium]MBT4363081.1 hypothetical protein [Desulfobacteraceae bacterium]MBT7084708.1 hypothetical protein [Desulfobacterales bacterium]MBT7697466.1 hypothetical protein [Desulfobacterales bacterium]